MTESTVPLSDLTRFLESFAPVFLAEDWDNVGLLLGDSSSSVQRVMTCLTVTPEVVAEGLSERAELIVSHHPMPFRPLPRITDQTVTGRMVMDLLKGGVAIYSPHTAFDSTLHGINQQIADRLELQSIKPLKQIVLPPDHESSRSESLGVGRQGSLAVPCSAIAFAERIKSAFGLSVVKFCGDPEAKLTSVGIACGSAGQFLTEAIGNGCDAFLTGETNFHTCLESLAHRIPMFLVGHYGSERFAVETLSEVLASEFPDLHIWASRSESDPIQYL